jgi:hypothetical protein
MVRRILLALVLCSFLPIAHSGGLELDACEGASCALELEFCEATAEEIEGQWVECCTGFCLGPQGPGCNGDSNQCRCYDIDRRCVQPDPKALKNSGRRVGNDK